MAGGFLAWVYLIHPIVSDPAYEGGVELVTISYPIADVLLLAAAARFIVGVQWDVLALRALVAWLVLTLVGDTIYAFSPDTVTDLGVANTLLLAGVLSLGLAGMHPTMTALTERQNALYEARDRVLLALVAGVTLLVPAVVVVQELRGESLHVVAALIATSLLAGLLVARFGYVTSRAAERERVLSRYVAELLGADPGQDLYRIAERAASQLSVCGQASVVAPGSAPSSGEQSLTLAVTVRGDVRAQLVVNAARTQLARMRRALETVTTELSLGLSPIGTGDPEADGFDQRTLVAASGTVVEARLPWALLGYADPSSLKLFVEHPEEPTSTADAGPIRAAIVAGDDPVLTTSEYEWEPWQAVSWHERHKAGFDDLAATMRELSEPAGEGG